MPPVTRRQTASFESGWSLGNEADVLIQSAANSNNAPLLLKLTHLTSLMRLRAEPRWPSCCDFMCLHGREVFTVEIAPHPPPPPLLLPIKLLEEKELL